MKKRALLLGVVSICTLFLNHGYASAAACTDKEAYGQVSLALPVLPSRGTYTIWTRLQAPDSTHNRYHLEINGRDCFEVGSSASVPGQWVWVSSQSNSPNDKVRYDFDHTSDNTVTLIGSDAGVRIDRLLLVKNDCVPENLGNNCHSDTVPISIQATQGATEVPPTSSGPVSGVIIPSATVSQDASMITKVTYFSDDTLVPSTKNFGLDTTLLANGSHRISIQITKTDSTITNEVTTLQVNNKQTAFSPVRRYIRLHTRAAVTISSIIGVGLLGVLGLLAVRHIRLQKRLLTFRGF